MSRALPEESNAPSSTVASTSVVLKCSYVAGNSSKSVESGTSSAEEGVSSLPPQKVRRGAATEQQEPSSTAACDAGDRRIRVGGALVLTTGSADPLAADGADRSCSPEQLKNASMMLKVNVTLNIPNEKNSLSLSTENSLDTATKSSVRTSEQAPLDHEAKPHVPATSPATGRGAASFPAQSHHLPSSEQAPSLSAKDKNVEHRDATPRTSSMRSAMAVAPQSSMPWRAPSAPRQEQPEPQDGPVVTTGPVAALPSSEQQKIVPAVAPAPASGIGSVITSLTNLERPPAPDATKMPRAGLQAAASFTTAAVTATSIDRGTVVAHSVPGGNSAQSKALVKQTVHVAPRFGASPSSAATGLAVHGAPASANVIKTPVDAATANLPPSATTAAASTASVAGVRPPVSVHSASPRTPENIVLVAPSAVASSPTSGPAALPVPSEAKSPPASCANSASPASSCASGNNQSVGRWTREEHEAFLEGLKIFGREWKKVATRIPTRTSAQIRSHAQKYFARLAREERQHRAAAAAAAVAAHQPVGLAASTGGSATGGAGAAGSTTAENLPPSVMQNVERILADPAGVQREVERTLGALQERYRLLQERLEEQQRRQRQAAAAAQRHPQLPPRGRDPRAGGKMLLAASMVEPGPSAAGRQQQQQLLRPRDDTAVSGRKRAAAEVAVEIVSAPAPAASSPSAPVADPSNESDPSGLEIRSAELIALQVLGGALSRSGSRDPLNQPSRGTGTDASREAAVADVMGSGGVSGSNSPLSAASVDSSSETKDDGGKDDRHDDAKKQRTSE